MRFADADHVDVSGFYARLPQAGRLYRLLGHLGVVLAVLLPAQPVVLGGLLGGLLLLWLVAWYHVVGTLWRATIVAACLVAALRLTLLLLEQML